MQKVLLVILDRAEHILRESAAMSSMLEAGELSKPEFVKKALKHALSMGGPYIDEIVSIFDDPVKRSAVLEELPAENRQLVLRLLNGRVEAEKDLVELVLDLVPNLDVHQKAMLRSLASGDTADMLRSANDLFELPDGVEKTRQSLLDNPEMLELLGIEYSILQDPEQFAMFMRESMEGLETQESTEQEPAPVRGTQKLFHEL